MILDRPEEPGKKYALTFTILVHVGLLVFLFLGVQWKSSKPEVMEVELWSAQPTPATHVAPPPPPEPEVKPEPKPIPKVEPKPEPPPPKKPDIAIKQEKKPEPKKPEPPKPEPKKPEPKPEVKPPPKVDPFKEMLEREEKQRNSAATQARLAAAADAEQREQRASANKRGAADYANKIRVRVRSNIALPPSIQGNPEAIFEVNQLPTREILSVKLKRSSGNSALDEAIERAIRKSSPLPAPDDPSLFQRDLIIKYKPFEE
ncbi:MAG TPA: energy transducer TonB [Azonexus sp.]|nr:energy transducer TonB [Azonexus sp.]